MKNALKVALLFLLLCAGVVLCDDNGKAAADEVGAEEEGVEVQAPEGDEGGAVEEEPYEGAKKEGKNSESLQWAQLMRLNEDKDDTGHSSLKGLQWTLGLNKDADEEEVHAKEHMAGDVEEEEVFTDGRWVSIDKEHAQSLMKKYLEMDEDLQSLMKELDTDKDGKVSREDVGIPDLMDESDPKGSDELNPWLQFDLRMRVDIFKKKFEESDDNGDGFLSMEEFQAFVGTFRDEDRYPQIDRNRDRNTPGPLRAMLGAKATARAQAETPV